MNPIQYQVRLEKNSSLIDAKAYRKVLNHKFYKDRASNRCSTAVGQIGRAGRTEPGSALGQVQRRRDLVGD
jgi:hypothetical protein